MFITVALRGGLKQDMQIFKFLSSLLIGNGVNFFVDYFYYYYYYFGGMCGSGGGGAKAICPPI